MLVLIHQLILFLEIHLTDDDNDRKREIRLFAPISSRQTNKHRQKGICLPSTKPIFKLKTRIAMLEINIKHGRYSNDTMRRKQTLAKRTQIFIV